MTGIRHLRGTTFHGRKGPVRNTFRYGVDYVWAEDGATGPRLFGRNRPGLMSLWDRDHGGAPGKGAGAAWVRQVLADDGLPAPSRLSLLAQPRLLGHVFNPVSFWLCHDADGALLAVVAEVTNTYGDRHSYLCRRDDMAPLGPDDTVVARKIFHVSPFQPVKGVYRFRFDIRDDRVGIWIDYDTPGGGVFTNLIGPVAPLTATGILGAGLRRPFGSRRVLALIHWQALRLWWKGAAFRNRPEPPADEVTR
jgi:uncharacterized protein